MKNQRLNQIIRKVTSALLVLIFSLSEIIGIGAGEALVYDFLGQIGDFALPSAQAALDSGYSSSIPSGYFSSVTSSTSSFPTVSSTVSSGSSYSFQSPSTVMARANTEFSSSSYSNSFAASYGSTIPSTASLLSRFSGTESGFNVSATSTSPVTASSSFTNLVGQNYQNNQVNFQSLLNNYSAESSPLQFRSLESRFSSEYTPIQFRNSTSETPFQSLVSQNYADLRSTLAAQYAAESSWYSNPLNPSSQSSTTGSTGSTTAPGSVYQTSSFSDLISRFSSTYSEFASNPRFQFTDYTATSSLVSRFTTSSDTSSTSSSLLSRLISSTTTGTLTGTATTGTSSNNATAPSTQNYTSTHTVATPSPAVAVQTANTTQSAANAPASQRSAGSPIVDGRVQGKSAMTVSGTTAALSGGVNSILYNPGINSQLPAEYNKLLTVNGSRSLVENGVVATENQMVEVGPRTARDLLIARQSRAAESVAGDNVLVEAANASAEQPLFKANLLNANPATGDFTAKNDWQAYKNQIDIVKQKNNDIKLSELLKNSLTPLMKSPLANKLMNGLMEVCSDVRMPSSRKTFDTDTLPPLPRQTNDKESISAHSKEKGIIAQDYHAQSSPINPVTQFIDYTRPVSDYLIKNGLSPPGGNILFSSLPASNNRITTSSEDKNSRLESLPLIYSSGNSSTLDSNKNSIAFTNVSHSNSISSIDCFSPRALTTSRVGALPLTDQPVTGHKNSESVDCFSPRALTTSRVGALPLNHCNQGGSNV